MDPARFETLCFLYVGVLLSGCGGLLALSTGDWTWAIIFSTGPVFLGYGLYWLRNPNARSSVPREYGPRLYAIIALAIATTVVAGGLLFLQFA